jgi:hypothetical protein
MSWSMLLAVSASSWVEAAICRVEAEVCDRAHDPADLILRAAAAAV